MSPKSAKTPSIKFETHLVTSDEPPVYHYLHVEKEWVKPLGLVGNFRRVICTVNGKITFQCSLMGDGKGAYLISVNKEKRDAVGIGPGDKASVVLVKDESKYGLPMPPELKEVLKQDPEGERLFEAMTKGRQRSAIYYVGKAKDIDRRIHNALIIVEHIKNNDGKIDESKLHKELRRPIEF